MTFNTMEKRNTNRTAISIIQPLVQEVSSATLISFHVPLSIQPAVEVIIVSYVINGGDTGDGGRLICSSASIDQHLGQGVPSWASCLADGPGIALCVIF